MRPALLGILFTALLAAAEHRGTVKSAGLPVPGASVTATFGERKLAAATDESGQFVFADLPSGPWTLEVEIFGFAKQSREVFVGAQPVSLDFDLKLERPAAPAQPAAAAKPATPARNGGNGNGYQQLAVTQTARTELLAALNSNGSQESAQPAVSSENANESFLVTGSLSRGLQVSQEDEPFFGMRGGPGLGMGPDGAGMAGGPGMGGPGGEGMPSLMGGGGMMGGPGGGMGGPGGMGGAGGMRGPGMGGPEGKRFGGQRPPWMGERGAMRFGNRRDRGRESIRFGANFSLRNSALDARNYSLTGQTVNKPSYAQSRFGFTMGGPLRIPKLIDDEKTFFFVNYGGSRSRSSYSGVATLPSLLERAGDFSQSVNQGSVTIYDPTTNQPFPGNVLPTSRLNSAALGLLAYIPQANQTGKVQNYQYVTSYPNDSDNLNIRFMRSITSRDRLSIGYGLQRRGGESVQLFGFRDSTSGRGQNANLGWTHTVHRGLINTLQFSFNRNRNDSVPYFAYGADVASALGITGASTSPLSYGPPNLSFTNFGGLTDGSPSLRRAQTASLSEGLLLVHGRHSFRFGGDYRRTQTNSFSEQNGRGTFTFTGLATSAIDSAGQALANTGFDFADFLLGLPHSSSVRYGSSDIYFRGSGVSWYVQDDFRVRSNLSINLGLRYEYLTPVREKYNRMANLDIAPGFTGVAVVTPGSTGPYTGVFPDGLVNSDRNNFAPRIGIAWKPIPNDSLQVRMGYGVYFNGSVYDQAASRLAQQPPFAKSASLVTSLAEVLTLQNGFATSPSTSVTNTYAVDRDYLVGYAQTWSFSVQHNLPASFLFETGYLGTKGTRLDIQRIPNRAASGSELTAEQRRIIGYATGFIFDSSEGNSIYHAAQFRLTRRFRRGVSTNVMYTFGKSIDDVSTFGGGAATVVQNDKDLRAERGLSSFDQRHNLNISYMLTSPWGSGTRSQVHGLSGRLLANWTLAGGITARSGSVLTATVAGNRSDSSGTGVVGSSRADATGLPLDSGSGFFNLLAFTTPAAGLFGSAGRNTIRGPFQLTMNASFGRAFQFGERRSMDLRIESTNLLNQVNISRIATTVNASNYGLATGAGAMRSVSLNLRVRF